MKNRLTNAREHLRRHRLIRRDDTRLWEVKDQARELRDEFNCLSSDADCCSPIVRKVDKHSLPKKKTFKFNLKSEPGASEDTVFRAIACEEKRS